jgi:tRNA (guanine37-N1)-methyltransferase
LKIDVLTLFPEMFRPYVDLSILGRAQDAGILQLTLHNIRDHTTDKHHITDLPPFGGGGGMILKPEPIFRAIETIQSKIQNLKSKIILLSPQGRPFTQTIAQELSDHDQLILICGRYEGVDERVRAGLVTDEISVGDYVLTGGELPALILIDAITRLLPNALGAEGAAETDSHATGLLEGAHYTKPVEFRGMEVPAILRSGNTIKINQWRREQALRRTWQRRPDLLLTADLSPEDKQFLATLALEWVGRD